jgi:hypothetical protein
MINISLRNTLYGVCPRLLRPYWDRVEASDIGTRLSRGIFWSMAGSVISRGLMLCATVLVARMLGKTVYGELGMIQSTVGMFGVFAGFGLGLTATKHVAEFRQSDPERAGRIIGLSGYVRHRYRRSDGPMPVYLCPMVGRAHHQRPALG